MNWLIAEKLSEDQKIFIDMLRRTSVDAEVIIYNPETNDRLIVNIGIINVQITLLAHGFALANSHTCNIKNIHDTYEMIIYRIIEEAMNELEHKIKYLQNCLDKVKQYRK